MQFLYAAWRNVFDWMYTHFRHWYRLIIFYKRERVPNYINQFTSWLKNFFHTGTKTDKCCLFLLQLYWLNDYSHVAWITVEKTNSFYVHSAKEQKYGEVFTKRFLIHYCTTFSEIQKLFLLSSEKIIFALCQGLTQTLQKQKLGEEGNAWKSKSGWLLPSFWSVNYYYSYTL